MQIIFDRHGNFVLLHLAYEAFDLKFWLVYQHVDTHQVFVRVIDPKVGKAMRKYVGARFQLVDVSAAPVEGDNEKVVSNKIIGFERLN